MITNGDTTKMNTYERCFTITKDFSAYKLVDMFQEVEKLGCRVTNIQVGIDDWNTIYSCLRVYTEIIRNNSLGYRGLVWGANLEVLEKVPLFQIRLLGTS